MVIITDFAFLSENRDLTDIPDCEKIYIFYNDNDMMSVATFNRMRAMAEVAELMPYKEVGGIEAMSFVAGALAAMSESGIALIVGNFESSETKMNFSKKSITVLTSNKFISVPNSSHGSDNTAFSKPAENPGPVMTHQSAPAMEMEMSMEPANESLPFSSSDDASDIELLMSNERYRPSAYDNKTYAELFTSAVRACGEDPGAVKRWLAGKLGINCGPFINNMVNDGIFATAVNMI